MALCEGPRVTGMYVERARSMQAAALLHREAPLSEGVLASIDWPLLPTGTDGVPMLRLSGPTHAMRSFLRLMKLCQTLVGEQHVREAERLGAKILWPIFVVSHGRAQTAHLNWAASHVLGAAASEAGGHSDGSLSDEPPDAEASSHPVVAVVNPEEADAYRRHWPTALILALPEEKRPVGYARSIVKRALEWRSPFFWVCDDNVSAFVRVEVGADGRAQRHTDGALFREALLHVQRHEAISAIALAGFLRSNGTEVSKRHGELRGSVKIYKVLLHNSRQCAGVEYVAALTKFEDVAFPRELLLRGRKTLKVQTYAYKAVNTKTGGCVASRAAASDDLIHAASAPEVSAAEWQVIAHLRQWIGRDLRKALPARLRHPDSCKRRRTLGGSEECKWPSDLNVSDMEEEALAAATTAKAAAGEEAVGSVAEDDNDADDDDDVEDDDEEEGMVKSVASSLSGSRVTIPPPPPALPSSYAPRWVVPAREELIGSRIRVWWEGENRWYSGRVHNYSSSRGHFVAYDDGERTFEDLCEVRWLHEHDTDSDEERPLRERRSG